MPSKKKNNSLENNDSKEFKLTNAQPVEEEVKITAEDFKLVDSGTKIHDQKLETKPTTFFKDALRRFRKNKSSVVATWILGILILLAIFVPIFDQNDISVSHPEMPYLEPKLCEAGTGWWDGCRNYTDIVANQDTGYPAGYKESACSNVVLHEKEEINVVNEYGKGGYVHMFTSDTITDEPYMFNNTTAGFNFDLEDKNEIAFTFHADIYENYKMGKFSIRFIYTLADGEDTTNTLYLISKSDKYDEELKFDVSKAVKDQMSSLGQTANFIGKYRFEIAMDASDHMLPTQLFTKSIVFTTNSTNDAFKESWIGGTFTDANAMLKNASLGALNYWGVYGGTRGAFKVIIQKCDFTYDTYEAAFGNEIKEIGKSDIQSYIDKGWCNIDWSLHGQAQIDSFVILDKDHCPINSIISVKETTYKGKVIWNATVDICNYKYYGYTSMPKFLLGTEVNGKDMFKYVFEGLRTSLIMGIITAAICFTFGLCWGAFSGYFGGNVDLAMERFTDILSGMPWIVVMTLCIVHLGQTFAVFVLALCLTGWIGTAATTRTQFYRFKGREYVLASRTLGASDTRLIFRHILPNAMGTIITGAVLMIPGVIFSEATISYLGLGLKGLSSLGVILSDNQIEIHDHAFLLIFPSIVIALLMICFNLFGNGLRDAINPSLKGEGE